MSYKVLIVEDQLLVRRLLENYFENDPDYEVAGSIGDASFAMDYCSSKQIDLIMMDVLTEHNESGLDAAEKIKKHYPNIKIMIITSLIDALVFSRAIEANLDGLWYKDSAEGEIMMAVKRIMNGEKVWPGSVPVIDIGYAKSTDFTTKEIEVLRYLVRGLSYKEIAQEMCVEPVTVQYHVTNMLQKTGFDNKLKLALAVKDNKFIVEDI